jgi:predicted NAD-dependent protein-ADP-ribosyltransferase YbiA (DUF1768 family)
MNPSVTWDISTFFYGITSGIPKDYTTRFISGINEPNKVAGTGKDERNSDKLGWAKLNTIAFTDKIPWRTVLSNRFEAYKVYSTSDVTKNDGQVDYFVYMNFSIDNIEYRSVIHYLLAMYYREDPDYAIQYTMNDKDNLHGFWGSVDFALKEHQRRLIAGIRPMASDFLENFTTYIHKGVMAKFSQNPKALEILLATDNAVLSEKAVDGTINDLPWLMKAREELKNEDAVFYYKSGANDSQTYKSELTVLDDVTRLNISYSKDNSTQTMVMGNVLASTLNESASLSEAFGVNEYLQKDLVETPRVSWVYIRIGAVAGDWRSYSKFGVVSFVKRHVYSMERYLDHSSKHLYVGLQTTPTSIIHEYVKIQTDPRTSIYLEPTTSPGIFHIMVVSLDLNQRLIENLDNLVQESNIMIGTGIKPISIQPPINEMKEEQIVPTPQNVPLPDTNIPFKKSLNLAEILYQWTVITRFMNSNGITSFNSLKKKKFAKDFYNELSRRSYETGSNLLQSSNRREIQRIALTNFLNVKFVKSFFLLEEINPRVIDKIGFRKESNGVSYWSQDGKDYKINYPEAWAYLANHSRLEDHSIAIYYFLYDSLNVFECSVFTLPATTRRLITGGRGFDLITFESPITNAQELTKMKFRGSSWKMSFSQMLGSLPEEQKDIRVLIEIPDQDSIHQEFYRVMERWVKESNDASILTEFVIICLAQEDSNTFKYLVESPLVAYRHSLPKGYIEEDIITSSRRQSSDSRLICVLRTDKNGFFPHDNNFEELSMGLYKSEI